MSHAQNPLDNESQQEQKLLQSKQNTPLKPTSETNPHQEVQFQKNYPKNIFIPLLEYLSEMGFKSHYQKIIGTRDDFEGKNVVSLSEIFLLLNQDWFNQSICREKALVYISNRILINSKIKKKLFHLLMSKQILLSNCLTLKDFKRQLSKGAYIISKQIYPYDEAFDFPNIIIYLLNTFLSKLSLIRERKHEKGEEFQSKQEIQDDNKLKNHNQTSSKQQYKYYVKQIVQILSAKYINIQTYYDLYYNYNEIIARKESQFREKYGLNDGIPNWTSFANIICLKCIQFKKKGAKITNFSFHQWINQYKTHITTVGMMGGQKTYEEISDDNENLQKIQERITIQPSYTSIIQKLSCFNKRYRQDPDTLKVTVSTSKQFMPLVLNRQSK